MSSQTFRKEEIPWEADSYFQQHDGQLALFQPEFIRDADCTKDTPVIHGRPDSPIYGTGKRIRPRVPGRRDSEYMKKILLEELLPLEEYDRVILLISGGKDSIASYYRLLELGVPKQKIEFWHHDIDGGNPTRRMDWRCTSNYIRAFSVAEQIPLRMSWRKNGFFGERIGASEPIEWQESGTREILQCPLSKKYIECQKLKERVPADMEKQLEQFGYRMKFPMKTGDFSRRWCSAYLKIMVADTVLRNLHNLEQLGKPDGKSGKDIRLLVVSGERRGESAGRSKYNEMEVHRTNAAAKSRRIVHQWRPVIDYSEKDVWEVLKRHKVNPHPCYRAGWNRCSCAMCSQRRRCLQASGSCIRRIMGCSGRMRRCWDLHWIMIVTWIHLSGMQDPASIMEIKRQSTAWLQVNFLWILSMCRENGSIRQGLSTARKAGPADGWNGEVRIVRSGDSK